MPSIAAFLSFACIMSFTPGPNNIMALSSASDTGSGRGSVSASAFCWAFWGS